MTGVVRHNEAEKRYELAVEGGVVFATYERMDSALLLTHTVTPPALRGQGLASRLVKGMLADIRQQGLKVVPVCSFVDDYIERHPEERDLLAGAGAA